MAYNIYSLPDVRAVLSHPDIGTANLHQCGRGKMVISAAGDLTSHTTTADGYVVVNRLKSTSGQITIEVPQNSLGDWFLRRWARMVYHYDYRETHTHKEQPPLWQVTADSVGFPQDLTGI